MKLFVSVVFAMIALAAVISMNPETVKAQEGGDLNLPLLIADEGGSGSSGSNFACPELPSARRGHFQGNGRPGGTNTGSWA